MLFTTFYFSGTGNTKWVVEQFKSTVIQSGHQAELYSIDDFKRCKSENLIKIVKESTCIGFANPIYGADIPSIMKAFIRFLTDSLKTEKVYSKPFYFINTFGYVNAYGPFEAKKLFDKDCFKLMAYVNIRVCNNISTYRHKSQLVSSKKLRIRKARAEDELKIMINRLLSSKKHIKGIGPYLLPGILIRKKTQKVIQNNYQLLSVQAKTCNRCMLCLNNCPTRCIKLNNQQFEFSAECTACMRCYNFCPTASIWINGIYTDPKEYFRYRGPE
ncbi:EFR1 family ferrodoxin [Clostridium merdae]|uniref:EFR1 family ferrodoxin n=1 Tax=Clostridium merdae TaxID=1958780 RepID=UPI000A26B256|nr:EFR1 family ferrodoxin [Clostridium merdae]